jgi:thiol-disulfide isomerase/thioredoxin
MEVILLACRLILAGIFGVAGVAKLADIEGSRNALEGFGVPTALIGVLSILLPLAELTIAISLLFTASSWFGAIGGVALLGVFIAGMVREMIRGNAPDCHCFGQLHSEPVSPKSLVRNVLFLVPASVLAIAGRQYQGMSIAGMNMEIVQLFGVVIGVGLLVAILLFLKKLSEQQTQIIRRIELLDLLANDGKAVERHDAGDPHDGLPIGAFLPDFQLVDVSGTVISRESLLESGLPTIFFYVSLTCTPCQALVPKFEEWFAEFGGRVNFVFISSGKADQNIEKFGTGAQKWIILQKDREFTDLVQAKWTPAAVFVDAVGKIASHVATGEASIIELVDKIRAGDLKNKYSHFMLTNGNPVPSKVPIGGSVPEFSIEDLNGNVVTSSDLIGKTTLITFWSPTCQHCARMIDEIKEWDLSKGPDAPDLLVFSSGDAESHRELGLRSPIIIDKDLELAGALGMYGTPSAIVVDKDGRFASETAIGAGNIWALVGRK